MVSGLAMAAASTSAAFALEFSHLAVAFCSSISLAFSIEELIVGGVVAVVVVVVVEDDRFDSE